MGNSEKCHRLADQVEVRLEMPAKSGSGQMPWRCAEEKAFALRSQVTGLHICLCLSQLCDLGYTCDLSELSLPHL